MARTSYRPLAGCKLFRLARELVRIKKVTVPLRGVSCFSNSIQHLRGMVNCICSALIGRPIS